MKRIVISLVASLVLMTTLNAEDFMVLLMVIISQKRYCTNIQRSKN